MTSTCLDSPSLLPFIASRARDVSLTRSALPTLFTAPTASSTAEPTSLPSKAILPGPTIAQSALQSLIHTETYSSKASSRSHSLQSTVSHISPTSTNISSEAMEVVLPTRRRARQIEIFGKRPFEFRFSRHRDKKGEKEKKRQRNSSSDSGEENSTAPVSPTTTVFATNVRDGKSKNFSFESSNGAIDLSSATGEVKSAYSARQTDNSASISSTTRSHRSASQDDEVLGFPSGRPLHRASTRNHDLEPAVSNVHISSTAEPHPGTLVTFSCNPDAILEQEVTWSATTTYSSANPSPTSMKYANANDHAAEAYHLALKSLALADHLFSTVSSSPTTFPNSTTESHPHVQDSDYDAHTTSTHPIDIPDPQSAPLSMRPEPKTKLQNINYQTRKLTHHALHLEQQNHILRYGDSHSDTYTNSPYKTLVTTTSTLHESKLGRGSDGTLQNPSTSSSSPSSSPAPTSTPSPRTNSTSSTASISTFLQNIRASFEARQTGDLGTLALLLYVRDGDQENMESVMVEEVEGCGTKREKMAGYDVFADEQERGFLEGWLGI